MNETVARVGGQLRQALAKVRDAWKAMAPARRKLILMVAAGLVLLAVVLVIVLNGLSGRYVVLYPEMKPDESVQALAALQNAGMSGKLNAAGQLEVPSNQQDAAMMQLAVNGIPSVTPNYNLLAEASGLTTTETEKKEYIKAQWQDRLATGLKSINGIQNAIVNITLGDESNRVWDTSLTQSSAAVQLTLKPGILLAGEQVQGIRSLVGYSVGIDPVDVVIIDQNGNMLADEGQQYDIRSLAAVQFTTKLDLEAAAESRLEQNASEILSLRYPNAGDYRVTAKVKLNTDTMVQETMEYFPLEGTNHGVIDEREDRATMGLNQVAAEGVVGETDNTDVPAYYVDENGDGIPEYVDWDRYIDYAVSYTLTQIEKQDPAVEEASLAVVVADTLSDEARLEWRESLRAATNLPIEQVTIQAVTVKEAVAPTPAALLPTTYIYIASAAALALILILVLVLLLRRRARKKQLALEAAAAEAEAAEAERIQMEIEERKKQLKDAAIGDESENAIINEVRDFAKTNPEIAANLLRNWLKDGVD